MDMYEFLLIETAVLLFFAGVGWAFYLIEKDRRRATEVELETYRRGIKAEVGEAEFKRITTSIWGRHFHAGIASNGRRIEAGSWEMHEFLGSGLTSQHHPTLYLSLSRTARLAVN